LIDLPAAAPAPGAIAAANAGDATAELAVLRDAVTRLRAHGQAKEALALLEEHDRRFPEGTFSRAAAILRIEALMVSGRQREAWVRLEALPSEEVHASPLLRIARAELRSLHGHCPEALADLMALGAPMTPAQEARVVRVRSSCQASERTTAP